jgi:hypothetical protein
VIAGFTLEHAVVAGVGCVVGGARRYARDVRKHLLIASVVGCIPIAFPAVLIGRAGLNDFLTLVACVGLIAPATALSLIVFFGMEPNFGRGADQTRRSRIANVRR